MSPLSRPLFGDVPFPPNVWWGECRRETIRVYDAAHGVNELHRYTKELGKQPGEVFHRGTLGEGMRSAINAIKHGHQEMIDGWRRR